MKSRAVRLCLLVTGLGVAAIWLPASLPAGFNPIVVQAQEGHPLSGTWSGDWGPTPTNRTHVTIVMNWDGKAITGTWNPGPDSAPLTSVYLDPANWTVRIEADPKDATGKVAHTVVEGRIDDLSSYHRKITGTWARGTAKGDVRLTRD